MSEYLAPSKEIEFVLRELAGLEAICALPGFEEASPDVVSAVLDEAGKFARGVLSPLNAYGDQHGAKCIDNAVQETEGFADAYRQFAAGGYVALAGPTEFGGMGMPECVAMAMMDMVTAANMSFALCPMLSQGAINALRSHASETLQATYLEKLITGEWTGTMNLTEPQAGSDLAAVRTRAVPEGEHYRLSGTKIYITWGDHQMTDNIVHLVLARTPDAPEGVKGISLFVVPKFLVNEDGSLGERNDVYPASIEHKMGIHASPTCVLNFGDNDGAVGYLVGEENKGLVYMFTMMNHARLNVGVQGVAISERAYQKALGYARERIQGVPPGKQEQTAIIDHPDVRRMLMQMKVLTEGSRALCYVATASFDMGHHSDDQQRAAAAIGRGELLTPLAKAWSTEIAQEVTSLGIQIHGGMGYIEETGAAQFYRDARITSIYEGTTAIQANDLVGRKLLRDGGQQMRLLLDDMRATQQTLAGSAELAGMAAELALAIEGLAELSDYILAEYEKDPCLPGAVSFNLLMAAGTAVVGWLLGQGALVALQKQAEDPVFYKAKVTVAQFYAEQILPRAGAYLKAAQGGSAAIMGLQDEQF